MRNEISQKIPLYRKLADTIEATIRLGTYGAGDRLPSLRQSARVHGVSLSTVLQAYRSLEDAQLIETRPKAGHFVVRQPLRLLEPDVSAPPVGAAPVAIAGLVEMVMNSAGMPDLISFASGYPTGPQVPVDQVERAMVRAVQRSAGALGRYPAAFGFDGLRQAIARRSLSMGCVLDPRDLVLTTGTTEAISLCLRALLKPGDTVALESPASFGFLQILEALELRALEIPTHPRFGISVDALALALRDSRIDAILATPTLSNPMGTRMPTGERERLVALLARHRVPLIEDVIYNDLAAEDAHRRAVKSFDRDGWVLVCSSYSKTVAPGLRVGWLHAGRFRDPVRKLKSALSGGNCAINELALTELLTESNYGRQLRRLHRINRLGLQEARRVIASSFPAGTRVIDPAGGSTLWLEMPNRLDSQALFQACMQERILIAPGTLFSASDAYRHCIRLNIPGACGTQHLRALKRVGEMASALAQGSLPPSRIGKRREADGVAAAS